MSPFRSDHSVLVIAPDPLLAALVGALVEGTDLKAAFPAIDERADDALMRVKPLAAVLVDVVLEEATCDVFLKRARKRRVPVMLFGKKDAIARAAEWARGHRIATFALPAEVDALRQALERLPAGDRAQVQRTERRRRGERSAEDGQLTFFDATGRRWWIYDRRGNDNDQRRATVHRSFVSDSGETRGCDLAPGEETKLTADVLESQLAHAKDEKPAQR